MTAPDVRSAPEAATGAVEALRRYGAAIDAAAEARSARQAAHRGADAAYEAATADLAADDHHGRLAAWEAAKRATEVEDAAYRAALDEVRRARAVVTGFSSAGSDQQGEGS